MAHVRDTPRETANAVEARQGGPRRMNLRVLIQSLAILAVICLVAAVIYYS
ncbi:MAG: hypothetical protein AB7G34_09485 [Hyphomicrobiales bacterium]